MILSRKSLPWSSQSLAAAFILMLVAASCFSRAWDPDFFWHLATGDWIVANRAIPRVDPFSGTALGTIRESLILKQYWLAQAGYSLIYKVAGFTGLAVLKSAIFVMVFWLLFRLYREKGAGLHAALPVLALLYEHLLFFRADRPNTLSFLGLACLLYLLETGRWRWLPLLMLVWANMHAGYLLGIVIIILYLGARWLSSRDFRSELHVYVFGGLALLAGFVNPTGILGVTELIRFQGSTYQQQIFEFLSPARVALHYNDYYLGYWLIALAGLVTLVITRLRCALSQVATFGFLLAISLWHGRYMPFLAIAGAAFLPLWLARYRPDRAAAGGFQMVALGVMLLLFVPDVTRGRGLTRGIEAGRYPEQAADYIRESGARGRIFSNDVWGGYLLWAVPGRPVMNDGRALSEAAFFFNQHLQKASPGWQQALAESGAEIVLVSALNPIGGEMQQLWLAIAFDSDWVLVYSDEVSLLYYRKSLLAATRAVADPKLTPYEHALALARKFVEKHPATAFHWANLGSIHRFRNEPREAYAAYRRALELDPGNEQYRVIVALYDREAEVRSEE